MQSATNNPIGVLLLGHGSPERIEDIEPYLKGVIKMRPVSEEKIREIANRYRAIGGASGFNAITASQARALQEILDLEYKEGRFHVYAGMRHWNPYMKDTLLRMHGDGIRKIIAIVLAPHYSGISIGAYQKELDEAMAEHKISFDVQFVERWHTEPNLIACIAEQLTDALSGMPSAHILFTAHSLPKRLMAPGDPYERELYETAELVVRELNVEMPWSFCFQSASEPGDSWLGPHIEHELIRLGREGVRAVLACPIGFVSDHLEILYDLDIWCRDIATREGILFSRTASRNTHPLFIKALAAVALRIYNREYDESRTR